MSMPEYMRNYRATPKGKKQDRISQWKFQGLIGDYDKIYDKYLNTDKCEKCDITLEGRGNNKKCMDHNHITGEFRFILCSRCNMKSQTTKVPGRSVGITFVKKKKLWKYRKMSNGITHQKMFKNKQVLLWYKFIYLLTN